MSHKEIRFHAEARQKMLRGTTALPDAVRVTLGPRSKSVLMQKRGAPVVCDDGVTIAKEVALENAVSVASVLLLTEATMTEVADGEDQTPVSHELGFA